MDNLRLCLATQEEIKIVYNDAYIQNSIKQDDKQITQIIHPLVTYISCYNNNEFLGCFIKISQSDIETEGHSLLLKQGIRYSRKLLSLFIEFCFCENIERMTTFIPNDLQTVVNFCLKSGWKIEGIKRNAIIKNNQPVNVIMMGILRKEFLCHQ